MHILLPPVRSIAPGFRVLCCALTLFGLAPQSALAQTERLELEKVYRSWVAAMNTGNFRAWQECTASHRQAITYNMVVSRRGQWPQSFFQLPFRLPEIGTLSHLSTLQKGDAANLIYYGRVDFGLEGQVPPDNLILLSFVKEKTGWKFDNTRFFNLSGDPDVRHKAQLGDTSFLTDPQFQPSGVVPPTQQKVPVPDYAGDLWVVSHGYETTIRIGNAHETVVKDEERTDAILGGLSRDGLPITVTAKEIESDKERVLAVEVYALRPGKKAAKVWEYRPKKDADISKYQSKVWANAVTIPGG